MDDKIDAALDLLRRLPPQRISSNLAAILQSNNDLGEDLLSSVDQPLGVRTCSKTGKEYLTCDYNRDGDSYRSPWSGEFEPYIEDGPVPSPELREMEVAANEAFNTYRDMYYEGGISSVYLWDIDDETWAGVVLLKKEVSGKNSWDSIHVLEARNRVRMTLYRITSTVMLQLDTSAPQLSSLNLSGNLTRQNEKELRVENAGDHIANIGRLVEDMEIWMRGQLHEVYFGKTKSIVNDVRTINTLQQAQQESQTQREMVQGLQQR